MLPHKPLHFSEYADEIDLFEPCDTVKSDGHDKERLVAELLDYLQDPVQVFERRSNQPLFSKRQLLRGVLNTLAPYTLNADAIEQLNHLLQLELREKAIARTQHLEMESKIRVGDTKVLVWQGDITTLNTDAIVNAANNQLLGCFQPLHACIDNVIHSAAGVQLRDDCYTIIQKQGFVEPTGTAKITRAYNLPSRFVLHTVGPVVRAQVTEKNRADLAGTYISCLEICKEINTIQSIAFCGISTGVFDYPPEEAAKVAFNNVVSWLKNNMGCLDLIIFNVFSDKDKNIYKSLVEAL
ncbi:protein-ADP-ribose hydrolase [bacterium]|nr:protein-ADP-ribose hydrolase [bacterium]